MTIKATNIAGRRAQRSRGGHVSRGHLKRSVTSYTYISRHDRTILISVSAIVQYIYILETDLPKINTQQWKEIRLQQYYWNGQLVWTPALGL